MPGVGGASQGHHPYFEGEPEDNLADTPAVALGDPDQFGVGQNLAVGGQQGEALVGQPIGGAELPDATVPALGGVTPVLDEGGPNAGFRDQALELFKGEIADTEQTSPACSSSVPFVSQTDGAWLPGWTVGGGLEWKLAQMGLPNWLLRGEYRYSNFGTMKSTFFAQSGDLEVLANQKVSTQIATGGIAYFSPVGK